MDKKESIINLDSLVILKEIFENINKWLHFAEAKNAALIGLNGAFLFKLIEIISDQMDGELYNIITVNIIGGKLLCSITLLGIVVILYLGAILLSLKSFLPNTSKIEISNELIEKNNYGQDRILMFYLDIDKYESYNQYLIDIHKYYFDRDVEITDLKRIEIDYAKEILINSKITTEKYKLFKLALKLNFAAITVFIISIII